MLFLLGAGWSLGFRAVVNFSVYFTAAVLSCFIMYRIKRETLAERSKVKTDSPKWDKALLMSCWMLAYFGIYLIASLEASKAPQAGAVFWIGMALLPTAAALSLHALSVQHVFEIHSKNTERQKPEGMLERAIPVYQAPDVFRGSDLVRFSIDGI